ncbi:MAG: VanZ family protein [Acholeplasmataceae bacterium]
MKFNKWLIIIFILTIFIWSQSFLSGELSSQESGFITMQLVKILNFVQIDVNIDQLHIVIRKLAHFTEYFILSMFWLIYLIKSKIINIKNIIYILLIILMTAIIDEAIQLLHDDRSSSLIDVVIDFGGAITGIVVFMLCKMLYNRHVKNI